MLSTPKPSSETASSAPRVRAIELERAAAIARAKTLPSQHRRRLLMPPLLLTLVTGTALAVAGAPWMLVLAVAGLAAAVGAGASVMLVPSFKAERDDAVEKLAWLEEPESMRQKKQQQLNELLEERNRQRMAQRDAQK